jgi:hypothetical protein
LQYEDPDETSGDNLFIGYLQVFLWLPEKDSNLRLLIQSCASAFSACTNASTSYADLQVFYEILGVGLSVAY